LRRFDVDTAIVVGQSVFELLGRVTLLLAGYGVYELVLWQLITTIVRQIVNIVVAKRLISTLRLIPSLSRVAIREVFSYGVFAAATKILGMVWQEADRLLLGTLVGSSAVAYLSVTKNLVLRGMRALGGASSVLLPHFSASTELDETRDLFLTATWGLLCMTTLVFVPVTILIPDFLRLWIDAEFAEQAAWIGRVVAASCIVRGAFLPYQQLFGGVGKPQYLSVVTLGSGITNLLVNFVLISAFGLEGAGYTYAVSLIWGFGATVFAWVKVLEARSWRPLLRAVCLPIGMGAVSLTAGIGLRATVGDLGWIGLFGLGAALLCVAAVLVVVPEWLLGGRTSHASLLAQAVVRALPSGPWSRLVRVGSEDVQ
jgi:O-antigen/teichoic acid export membrane protein